MGKLPFLFLMVVSLISYETNAVPLMAISAMASAAREMISSITESIAPGHNKYKDPFAQSNETQKTINEIKNMIDEQGSVHKKNIDLVHNINTKLEKVGLDIFALDNEVLNKLSLADRTEVKLNKVLVKSDHIIKTLPVLTESIKDMMSEMVRNFFRTLENDRQYQEASADLAKHTQRIDFVYDQFNTVRNTSYSFTPETYEVFYTTALSQEKKSIPDTLKQMLLLVTPGEKTAFLYDGFLKFFANKERLDSFSDKCDVPDTYQNQLKRIYNMISITEYRALVMLTVATLQDEVKTGQSAQNDLERIYNGYVERNSKYLSAMKTAMAHASTEIMRCDPPQPLLDINSFSLTYFLGSYFVSTDQIGMRCSDKCEDINTVNKIACKTDLKKNADVNVRSYCPKRPCYGRLHSCKIKNSYQFCEANEGAGRRYWWVEKSASHDRRNSCDGRFVDTMSGSACVECMCECAEEGAESTATRTFSLMPQYADIKNNMVVSNVRLRKKDNVVQIQIEQAPLRPGGTIDRDNASWVPLDKLVYSQNVPEGAFWKIKDGKKIGLVYDEDYTYLRHNRKTLYLDDVAVEKDYVVTGVRFRNSNAKSADGSWNSSPIQLEVMATRFDYQNGILTPEKNEPFKAIVADEKTQRGKQYYGIGRSAVKLTDSQDPLKSSKNEEISHPNQEISFRRSSRKEIGQLTVPYFDSRPAASSSFIPLSGVGIFHRGARNYGGFIAPKLIGIDHSQYVEPQSTNLPSLY